MSANDVQLPPSPYPGLRPFTQSESRIFFGRELMVDEVIGRLIRQRLLVVHGDSGSGKSSLIYAGVLPVFEQQTEFSAFQWRTCHAVPGRQPLQNLTNALAGLCAGKSNEDVHFRIRQALSYGRDAAAELAELIRSGPEDNICVLLDQFEELFTQTPAGGAAEARQVIDFLIGLHQQPVEGLHVVLTMRSEFLGACAQFKDFAETVNETQYLLPRLKRQELLRAIRDPLHLYKGEVELALAEHLIEETADTSDQLPLIQHGLATMYLEHGKILTLKQYRDGKRTLAELLSDHADAVADRAEADVFQGRDERRVVERIFRAITKISADGSPLRNRQTLAQLAAITGEKQSDLQAVLRWFRAEGVSFLRPFGEHPLAADDEVDISHEALIRCWNRVSDRANGWLEREFKSGLAWRMLVEQARDHAIDRSNLLSPAAAEDRRKLIMAHTSVWSQRYGGQWDAVNQLVAASLATRKQSKRYLTVLWVALAMLFVGATTVVVFQINESKQTAVLTAGLIAEVAGQKVQLVRADEQKCFANIDILARAAQEDPEADPETPNKLRDQIVALAAAQTAAIPTEAASEDVNIAPRLYLYISDESQRSAAQAIADRAGKLTLEGRTVIVPSVALRRASVNALRCFSEKDCDAGKKLFTDVKSLVDSPSLAVENQTSNIEKGRLPATRPRHYELWFAPGPIVPTVETKTASLAAAQNITFSQPIVDRIVAQPGVPYPEGTRPAAASSLRKVAAIVLHDALAPDSATKALIAGRPDLRGPLTHWAVQSNGTIVFIADEGNVVYHAGQSIDGLYNRNTIGITVLGQPALANPTQLENFVRLVVDVADRWNIPTELILAHAESAMPAGRNAELRQQAPIIRQMVAAVRYQRASGSK